MSSRLQFDAVSFPEGSDELRAQVRAFIREERESGSLSNLPVGQDAFHPEFSRKLGERGWIGMMWPQKYGGHERSAIERYVVIEELLAAGAATNKLKATANAARLAANRVEHDERF